MDSSLSVGRPALSARSQIADVSIFKRRSAHGRRWTRVVVQARKNIQKDSNPKQKRKDRKGGKDLQRPGRVVVKKKESGGTTKLPGFMGTLKMGAGSTPRGRPSRRDTKTVFVAGASGRLGSRVVRSVLSEGFKVIAGVQNLEKAQKELADDVEAGLLKPGQLRKVQFVPLDIRVESSVRDAIGSAGLVISAVGAREADVYSIDGPRQIDGLGNIRLIDVAAELGVKQFVLISSLGTGKPGWPFLDLFWGVLSWKKKAEEALEKSGMAYTIIRPGNMGAPDNFGETHNMRIADRDTTFNGSVSRVQIAELAAGCCSNPAISVGKCLEVVAETKAPSVNLKELLSGATVEITQEEIAEKQRAAAQRVKDREAAAKLVTKLVGALQDIKERRTALQERKKALADSFKEVAKENSGAIKAAQQCQSQLDKLQANADAKAKQEAAAKAILAAAKVAAREGRILSPQEQKEVAFPILQPEAAAAEAERAEAEAKAKALAEAEAAAAAEAEAKEKAAAARSASIATKKKAITRVSSPAPKKAPVKATARMKSPPPIARKAPVFGSRAKKAPPAPLESTEDVVARVVEEAKREAQRALEEEIRKNEEASKKAAAAREKELETQRKVFEAACKKAADDREKAIQKAQADVKKRAEEFAAQRAAQAEKVKLAREEAEAKAKADLEARKAAAEAKKAEAEKLREEAKARKEAPPAPKAPAPAPVKAAAPAKAPPPKAVKPKPDGGASEGFSLGGLFGGFKAPWGKREPPVSPEVAARQAEARAWIENWRAGGTLGDEDDGADEGSAPEDESAGEWIRKWRAQNLEKQLPQGSRVKK